MRKNIKKLPKYPLIYEVNTWAWLQELQRRYGRPMDLGSIPDDEWDMIVPRGAAAIWLMGVWERSPAGIRVATQNPALMSEFHTVLPDLTGEDIIGSAYCIRRYVVDGRLGGPDGLAVARARLAERGVRLILDFVPNHLAPDNPLAYEHPEYFIRGTAEDLARDPGAFQNIGGNVIACGRDPFFPPWHDVLQLNVFHPGLRRAALDTLLEIASQSDGVRCDMAMLLINSIFKRTWGNRAGPVPGEEYWVEIIEGVKKAHPEFVFIAEAYWDMEWELQQQGFDFCYDKRLYDRLEHDGPEDVRRHLLADINYQNKLVRFIENHDEPRAAALFPEPKHYASAVTIMTLPGAKLVHEGQFDGRRVRLPAFLRRRPEEMPDERTRDFYRRLLHAANADIFHNGEWRSCELQGWPDNNTYLNLLAWCWQMGEEFRLIVVNFSQHRSQAMVRLPLSDLRQRSWHLKDALNEAVYNRDGNEMSDRGLYVDLDGWGFHFLEFSRS